MKIHDHAEYVSPGHPDRLADAIANSIVDLVQSPRSTPGEPNRSLAGVEVAIHDSTVFIDGRIAVQSTPSGEPVLPVDFRDIARHVFTLAGYNKLWGPSPKSLKVITRVCEEELSAEEADIRPYSDDQNIVIGYAIANPATNFLPPAHFLAHALGLAFGSFRDHHADRFGPDFKILVDITADGQSITWRKLVLSVQHARGITMEDQHRTILPALKSYLEGIEIAALKGALSSFLPEHLHLNGAGDFVIGGPRGDNGLSGKKLVVDHYGPSVPIGGGALCGKDVWKVDRCGPLRARQLAKRLVRSGHHEAKVILGWAPGEDIPSLRDVLVRDQPDTPWCEAPSNQVPAPRWFAIESIVKNLELTRVNWTELPIAGTFIGGNGPWEWV
jgi:S-adenosylmethionine synthetase